MDAETLERSVLDQIVPSDEDIADITAKADRMKACIMECAEQKGLDVCVRLAGSFSKGTFLSNPDLDVFLMFPECTERKIVTDMGLSIGESVLDNPERAFAENPYISGFYEGLDVDLVPCYRLKDASRIITSMDRTPFHTEYIMNNLDAEGKDQVRLLKKFMKGVGTYGAEPHVRGFSGYLCELLVVKYGSFRKVLEAALTWKKGEVIFIDDLKGPHIKAPILFHDPVDPKRNVASAVHLDTMCKFITAARAYLDKPRMEFFFPSERVPLDRQTLASRTESSDTRILTVSFDKPDILKENLHAQIWKTQYAIATKLDDFGFHILRGVHDVIDGRIFIAFELERDHLNKTRKHIGPPVWVPNAENFLKRWGDNPYGAPLIEDGVWTVIADRPFTDVLSMVRKEAPIAGIGKDVDATTMELFDHDRSISEVDTLLLTELLDPSMPWEH